MKRSASFSGFLLLLGLLMVFKQATYLPLSGDQMIMAAGLAVLIHWLVVRWAWAKALWVLLGLGFLSAPLAILSLTAPSRPEAIMWACINQIEGILFHNQFAAAGIRELIDYATDADKLSLVHGEYLGISLVLGLSVIMWLLDRSKQRSLWLLLVLSLSSLLWFTYVSVGFAFGLFFCAYMSEKLTEQGKGLLFGFTLPVVILSLAVLMTSATPIAQINAQLSRWTSNQGWLRSELPVGTEAEGFNLGQLGFYPLKSRLGGPIRLNKTMAFRIETDRKLYLRGRVLAVYSHNSWQMAQKSSEVFQPQETKTQSSRPESAIRYKIYDNHLNQMGLLTPLSVKTISIPSKNLAVMSGGTLSYTGRGGLKDIESYEVVGGELLQANQAQLLALPESYSPKVKALTAKIIGQAKSPKEKVTKIQNYLLTHYQYALAVETPPEQVDFVEYFLTQTDRGYCVYFASAATVMTRLAGLPSRYVEGFVTYDNYQRGRDQMITGERAHAWAEVYYEGAWHTLETTPTFTRATDDSGEDLTLKGPAHQVALGSKAHEKPEGNLIHQNRQAKWRVFLLRGLSYLIPIGVLGGIGLWLYLKFRAFFNPYRPLGKDLADEVLRPSRALSKRYTWLLMQGLSGHFDIENATQMTPKEILELADHRAPALGLNGLVEIVNQSLYDSNERDAIEIQVLIETYWQLYRVYFSTGERIVWFVRIAWKGRWRNGFYGKNTTT